MGLQKKILTMSASYTVLLFGLMSTANAALELRLGGLAYYDTQLDITWAADPYITGFGTWEEQQTNVSSLTIGGVSGWRLPSADVNNDNDICFVCADNEMGFLYFVEGITPLTPGVFGSIAEDFHWSGTQFSVSPERAFAFFFGSFDFDFDVFNKSSRFFAWPVHSGDVGINTVSEPEIIVLIGFGLLSLAGFLRIQRKYQEQTHYPV
ncbi:PEP-CTERM protein-sorting domain-containing protein [Nitrosomonas sp. Nm51]|uniref:hypothetical protein n=1 Tax=Nitrosomonas sp. Nm51 TaxID=133720 RepID=UPI0008B30A41|nr:hypothetical protein [Nitrosomonas sp. Nm51]SER63883.1 PEP-CTERM protein-sorting domain-containing protein [Nitrosomonas sp. Nm51]